MDPASSIRSGLQPLAVSLDQAEVNLPTTSTSIVGRTVLKLEADLPAGGSLHVRNYRAISPDLEVQGATGDAEEADSEILAIASPSEEHYQPQSASTSFSSLFFSEIQRFASTATLPNVSLPSFFASWFDELGQIYNFIRDDDLSVEAQNSLFFYLAHRYQYNAPFSQQENERLGYETSPLAITERNSYLRSSQTLWMHLASELIYQQLGTTEKGISIVWIDHVNFIPFLNHFYQVIEVSSIGSDTHQDLLAKFVDSYKEPSKPFYIFLNNIADDPKDRLKKAQDFASEMLKRITEKLNEIENNQILDGRFTTGFPPGLRKLALAILVQEKGLREKISRYSCTAEELDFLKERYNEQFKAKYRKIQLEIQKLSRLNDWSEAWEDELLKQIFELYLSNSPYFQDEPKFKHPAAIGQFIQNKNPQSENFIGKVLQLLSDINLLKDKNLQAFKEEILTLPTSKQNATDVVGIFYADSFEGLQALISPHRGEAMHNLVTVVGNLGYSPDSVNFLRVLIQGYPSFFPTQAGNSFLRAATEVKFLCLPKKLHEDQLGALSNLSIPVTAGKSLDFASIEVHFKVALENLASATHFSAWFDLYQKFLLKLLIPILSQPGRHLNDATLFAIKKMSDNIEMALSHQNKIHLFIRDIQNVLEAWMLYIDINPLVKDPVQIFQEALPFKPTMVHFTSYAMRSFTRVLQVLASIYSNKTSSRMRIQTFNQTYYELITNMERLKETADIVIAQSDAQIEEECDVYFIDVHPNNAVENQIFSHNILQIIETLASFSTDRPRTLVVDITLNSLSDSEIKKLISEANFLVQSGRLNLVLIQSLTKFSQLGLDKLSAGFLAAYNTYQGFWQAFNRQLREYQDAEPVDSLTLQFFSCLTHYAPRFQKSYIKQINQNTSNLYHKVLKNYQELNLPISKKVLALTCNTDLKTCYLAFNSKEAFAHIDPYLSVDVDEMSRFTGDIIKKFFIPLAEWLDLPLTERMSIGFPLSSINECLHVIRFTVGLEAELLDKYADIITYICFVLNRESNVKFLLEKRKDQSNLTYTLREQYFEEKVNIFKAMYVVDRKCAKAVTIKEPVESLTNAYRTFVLDKGTIRVNYYTQQSQRGGPVRNWRQTLNENQLTVHFGVGQDVRLDTRCITPFIKCLLASCFTQRRTEGANNEHTVNPLAMQTIKEGLIAIQQLNFGAFFYIRQDNCTWNRFGYYNVLYKNNLYKLSFDFKDAKLHLVINGEWCNESCIFIRKGHEITPAAWLDTEEKWRLFEQASYTPFRELGFSGYLHKPDPEDPTEVTLQVIEGVPRVTIERDKLAFKLDGFSLYCRKETKEALQLEIDFWGIKNPVHARFLSLFFCYVALYREKIDFDFVSKSCARITLLQQRCDLEKLKQVAKEILEQRELILFYFDKKRPNREDDKPLTTNSYSSLSRFCFGNSTIPYPKFMETLFCICQGLVKNSPSHSTLRLMSVKETDKNPKKPTRKPEPQNNNSFWSGGKDKSSFPSSARKVNDFSQRITPSRLTSSLEKIDFQGQRLHLTDSKIAQDVSSLETSSLNFPSSKEEMHPRKKKLIEKIQELITSDQKVGQAIDSGDCFYDAIAQALSEIGIQVSVKELRVIVSEAVQQEPWSSEIPKSMESEYGGIDHFEQYKKYVQYTNDELIQLKKQENTDVPTAPIWGDPQREGAILSEKYDFELRVISAGFNETYINEDGQYQELKQKKKTTEKYWEENGGLDQEEARSSMRTCENLMQERRNELYLKLDEAYWTDDKTSFTGHSKLCTIAIYDNHFIPILKK